MECYDDGTGTRRGAISHVTSVHVALIQSIDPIGSTIIMTLSQNSGDGLDATFSARGTTTTSKIVSRYVEPPSRCADIDRRASAIFLCSTVFHVNDNIRRN